MKRAAIIISAIIFYQTMAISLTAAATEMMIEDFSEIISTQTKEKEMTTDAKSIGVTAQEKQQEGIKISSPSAIAIDGESGRVLYEKNGYSLRPMASTTKMMTAILAIERGNLTELAQVSKRAARVGGSTAHLIEGEQMSLNDLLYALMLPSGNDAAIVIAEKIGGSVEQFIEQMNVKALEIGAINTEYGSPHGLDITNRTTAYDLAQIAHYGLQNQTFAKIVSTGVKSISRGGYSTSYSNTNELLRNYAGADGVKTGYTGPAGRCLVASASKDNWRVISVVMGADSSAHRSADSRTILDYVFENYQNETVVQEGAGAGEYVVERGVKDYVGAVIGEGIKAHMKEEEIGNIKKRVYITDKIEAPIKKGSKLGRAEFILNGYVLGDSAIYAGEEVEYWTVRMNFENLWGVWRLYCWNSKNEGW